MFSLDLNQSMNYLVKIVVSSCTSKEDKKDAYATMSEHFKSDAASAEKSLEKYVGTIFPILKAHINCRTNSIALEALKLLSHCLASDVLIKHQDDDYFKGILSDLFVILASSKDSRVCVKIFSCLCSMPVPIMAKHVSRTVSLFIQHYNGNKNVTYTGLCTIKRLCESHPNEMVEEVENWFAVLLKILTTSIPENQTLALEIVTKNFAILGKTSYPRQHLMTQLNKEGLGNLVTAMFYGKVPILAVKVWTWFLKLLGKLFFQLDRVRVINLMFKMVQDVFSPKYLRQCDLVIATYDLWAAIYDVFSLEPGEFPKLEKKYKTLLQCQHKNEDVALKSLHTHWHLICNIGDNINEKIVELLLPLLQLHLLPAAAASSRKSSSQTKSPKSAFPLPKYPSSFISLRLLTAKMLSQLLSNPDERNDEMDLEIFWGKKISCENMLKHHEAFMSLLLETTKSCIAHNEGTISKIWSSYLEIIEMIPDCGDEKILGVFVPTLKLIIKEDLGSAAFILQLLLAIPANMLNSARPDLVCQGNPKGSFLLFLMDVLLNENFVKKTHDDTRLFDVYKKIIHLMFNGVVGHISSARRILQRLSEISCHLDANINSNLWSALAKVMAAFVSKTNEINEGTGLVYDLSVSLQMLIYPVKCIKFSKLRSGKTQALFNAWLDLYATFQRAVNLLPGIEDNHLLGLFCEALSKYLDVNNGRETLDIVADMLGVVLKTAAVCNPPSDEKQFTPVSHFKKSFEKGKKEPASEKLSHFFQCSKQLLTLLLRDEKTDIVANLICKYISLIKDYFVLLNNYQNLFESISALSELVGELFGVEFKNANTNSKVCVSVKKFMIEVYASFEALSNVIYDSELLGAFEPFLVNSLVASGGIRRKVNVKQRAILFWNNTFGKNESLAYSDKLRELLLGCNSRIKPNLNRKNYHTTPIETYSEDAQFPDSNESTQVHPVSVFSPSKIHGSFLKRDDIKSPKSIKLFSPTKHILFPSPSKSSKRVRRKLPISFPNLSKDDFVEINDNPKKSRLLTERQKEVLRERKTLPMMYNTLDQSQDTLLLQNLSQDANSQMMADQKSVVLSNDILKENQKSYLTEGIGMFDCSKNIFSHISDMTENQERRIMEDEEVAIVAGDKKSVINSDMDSEQKELENHLPSSQSPSNIGVISSNHGETSNPDIVLSSQTQEGNKSTYNNVEGSKLPMNNMKFPLNHVEDTQEKDLINIAKEVVDSNDKDNWHCKDNSQNDVSKNDSYSTPKVSKKVIQTDSISFNGMLVHPEENILIQKDPANAPIPPKKQKQNSNTKPMNTRKRSHGKLSPEDKLMGGFSATSKNSPESHALSDEGMQTKRTPLSRKRSKLSRKSPQYKTSQKSSLYNFMQVEVKPENINALINKEALKENLGNAKIDENKDGIVKDVAKIEDVTISINKETHKNLENTKTDENEDGVFKVVAKIEHGSMAVDKKTLKENLDNAQTDKNEGVVVEESTIMENGNMSEKRPQEIDNAKTVKNEDDVYKYCTKTENTEKVNMIVDGEAPLEDADYVKTSEKRNELFKDDTKTENVNMIIDEKTLQKDTHTAKTYENSLPPEIFINDKQCFRKQIDIVPQIDKPNVPIIVHSEEMKYSNHAESSVKCTAQALKIFCNDSSIDNGPMNNGVDAPKSDDSNTNMENPVIYSDSSSLRDTDSVSTSVISTFLGDSGDNKILHKGDQMDTVTDTNTSVVEPISDTAPSLPQPFNVTASSHTEMADSLHNDLNRVTGNLPKINVKAELSDVALSCKDEIEEGLDVTPPLNTELEGYPSERPSTPTNLVSPLELSKSVEIVCSKAAFPFHELKNPFTSNGSPTRPIMHIPSPLASPVNGILKKRSRLTQSPSPPVQNRRVSFQLPDGVMLIKDEEPQQTEKEFMFTKIQPKEFGKVEKEQKGLLKFSNKNKEKKWKNAIGDCIYPELVKCSSPIEKIIPSLTFSRGVGHLIKAQNILTVGDLSGLSEKQVESLPIRSPKVKTVRNALRTFAGQLSREKKKRKPQYLDPNLIDYTSPRKNGTTNEEEAAHTPSRHPLETSVRHGESVKPTALFHDDTAKSDREISWPSINRTYGVSSIEVTAVEDKDSSQVEADEVSQTEKQISRDVDNDLKVICDAGDVSSAVKRLNDLKDADNGEETKENTPPKLAAKDITVLSKEHDKPLSPWKVLHLKKSNILNGSNSHRYSPDKIDFDLCETVDTEKHITDDIRDFNDSVEILSGAVNEVDISNHSSDLSSSCESVDDLGDRVVRNGKLEEATMEYLTSDNQREILDIKNISTQKIPEASIVSPVDEDILKNSDGNDDTVGLPSLSNDRITRLPCSLSEEKAGFSHHSPTVIPDTQEATHISSLPSDSGNNELTARLSTESMDISGTAQDRLKVSNTEKHLYVSDNAIANLEHSKDVEKRLSGDKVDQIISSSSPFHTNNAHDEGCIEELNQIDFTALSNNRIFDVVDQLDRLKSQAMEELRTRMLSHSTSI